MKLERVNDNQIRCMLTAADLENRKLNLGEMAYCTESANRLFRELVEQACDELDFDVDGHPLMVEAIPISNECLMLLITRVEDPEELDSRFARFTEPAEDIDEETYTQSAFFKGCPQTAFSPEQIPDPVADDSSVRVFSFRSIDEIGSFCVSLPDGLRLGSSLFKNPVSNAFLLVLSDTGQTQDFRCACTAACEYGITLKTAADPLPFFREHYTLLIKEDAIPVMRSI